MARILIISGIVLIVAGLVWRAGEYLGFGRLPGDIMIERGGLRIYFPFMTSLILSIIVSLILWLFNR